LIVDAHSHIGRSAVSGITITIDKLIATMDKNGVDKTIVQPHPKPVGTIKEIHDLIYSQSIKYTGRIYGLASINPHEGNVFYTKEAERCIKELGFLGLKLHPSIHLSPINSKISDIVFYTAARLNVPLMIHTGLGVPFTMPSLVIPRIKEYPNLKIIMAHTGEPNFAEEALIVAREYNNIFLETSWCRPALIKRCIDELGPERVMVGSDLPENQLPELMKYSSIDITESERETALSKSALSVFEITQ
jgi:hypothetical protein